MVLGALGAIASIGGGLLDRSSAKKAARRNKKEFLRLQNLALKQNDQAMKMALRSFSQAKDAAEYQGQRMRGDIMGAMGGSPLMRGTVGQNMARASQMDFGRMMQDLYSAQAQQEFQIGQDRTNILSQGAPSTDVPMNYGNLLGTLMGGIGSTMDAFGSGQTGFKALLGMQKKPGFLAKLFGN